MSEENEAELQQQRVSQPGTQYRIVSPEEQRKKRFRKRRRQERVDVVKQATHDDVVDAP